MQQNRPNTPKMTNRLIQHMTVEESTSIQWVYHTTSIYNWGRSVWPDKVGA